ncbi:hypothetical protein, partial [Microcoleus sp. B9-D4]|uniref:hypothetical protein n=1 Tax=Microcoleus sp. B9-D4 TaxID=2818711 RepID=UPI002FD17C4F
GSLGRDKGCKSPEMLCQTRIVFSDEYPAMGYPTEQRQTRHEARTITVFRLVWVFHTLSNRQSQEFGKL